MLEETSAPTRQKWGPFARVQAQLRELYYGQSRRPVRFRLWVLAVDFLVVGFFIAAPFLRESGLSFLVIDYLVAVLLALDIAARAVAWNDFRG